MLSILIPCYNFNIHNLVKDIWKQGKLLKINFEIICIEDGSSEMFLNHNIKNLQYVNYIVNQENIGRSKIRNLLAKKAKFNWLLFIDCDSKINNNKFLSNYIDKIINQIVSFTEKLNTLQNKKIQTKNYIGYMEKKLSQKEKKINSHPITS